MNILYGYTANQNISDIKEDNLVKERNSAILVQLVMNSFAYFEKRYYIAEFIESHKWPECETGICEIHEYMRHMNMRDNKCVRHLNPDQ
jgi:hypothetical protein